MALGEIEEKPFSSTIHVSGMIDVPPQNRAVVSAVMGGYIKDTPLLVGDLVKRGQLLVTVENPEFVTLQQNYLEAKEKLNYLKAEYERQIQLRSENITSQKNFLKAESEYKAVQAQYNGLKQRLRMLNFSTTDIDAGTIFPISKIYAPIAGSITKMNVVKGLFVSPAAAILEIIDNDHIHLELHVFEKDIMKLRKGQTIWFNIPESSSETFEAKVYLIGANIEENRTIKIHGHLKNESDHNFLTGMFVEADIVTADSLKKALPSEAVANLDDSWYLLQLISKNDEEYVFKKVEIQQGDQYNEYTSIETNASLDESDKFLTKGIFNVLNE